MAQYYFHRVTETDGAVNISLLEQPVVRRREGVQVETYPLTSAENPNVEGGIGVLIALERWRGDEALSKLLGAIFEQGYQAGMKSATSHHVPS